MEKQFLKITSEKKKYRDACCFFSDCKNLVAFYRDSPEKITGSVSRPFKLDRARFSKKVQMGIFHDLPPQYSPSPSPHLNKFLPQPTGTVPLDSEPQTLYVCNMNYRSNSSVIEYGLSWKHLY